MIILISCHKNVFVYCLFIYFSLWTPTPLPTHVLGVLGKGAFSCAAIRGQTDTVSGHAAESVLPCKAVHRLEILHLYILVWSHLDSCACVFFRSVRVYVHLLIIVIVLIILQAADGLCRVRKCGTLRVVLGAPETIFPQLVTFCRRDGTKENMLSRQKDFNRPDLLSLLPSAAPPSFRHHLLWWMWMRVCQCVIRKEFRNECMCNQRRGCQFQSVTHRWQNCPLPPCTLSQGAFSTSSLSFSLCKYLVMHPLSIPLVSKYIHTWIKKSKLWERTFHISIGIILTWTNINWSLKITLVAYQVTSMAFFVFVLYLVAHACHS